jgi:outer membrane protein TolC
LQAQTSTLLTYKEAVALALKHNFDIQLIQNQANIASVQNTYGNAGFLPRVDISSGASYSNNSTRQEFASGLNVNRNGAVSTNTNAGVFFNWTVFDGMRMFAAKERFNILEQQGLMSLKIQMEQVIESVTLLYYQIVRQQQFIKGIESAIRLTDERVKLTDKRKAVGAGSNVELLQARLDRNEQQATIMANRNLLVDLKSQLLEIMQAEATMPFSVDTGFVFENVSSLEAIHTSMDINNRQLQFARQSVQVFDQNIRELKAQRYPSIGLNTNYVFSRSENAAGFALLNRNLGYTAGISLNWNIFNGGILKNQIQVADLQRLNTAIQVEKTKRQLITASYVAYTRWVNDKAMLELEEENIRLAQQSLEISEERLKQGLGNFLEIRQSQQSFEDAITRLVNARYNVKQSETTLRRISGDLIK